MRKTFELFKSNKHSLFSLLLLVLAVMLGASTAMAIGTADDKGLTTDLTGTAASATQVRQGYLADPEIDEYIAKFQPYRFPLDTDFRKEMKQSSVSSYEVDHYSSGSSLLDCVTTTAFTSSNYPATINLYTYIASASAKMFAKDTTISVSGVSGYKEDGTTASGDLMLVVTEKAATTITVEALNPPLHDGAGYIPSIPLGTKISVCSNACSESQMQVEPENYQPRPVTMYLQKKITNIVLTDHFKEIIKKIPFFEQDIKDNALYNFRRKNARTLWIGVKSKKLRTQTANMGDEYVYTSEGVLRQLTMSYTLPGKITFADLVALCKMQFTTYSVNNEANVYAGKNFMEGLLNIDFTKHKDITFEASTVMGIDIKAFKTTFGTLNFKYDPTLDDLGYADYAVVADIKNAVRYVKLDEKTQVIDMKEGAGETREASRDIVTQIDAPALKGFNSILVSPASAVIESISPNINVYVTQGATLTVSPANGEILFLTAAVAAGTNNPAFEANSLVQYDGTGWGLYPNV